MTMFYVHDWSEIITIENILMENITAWQKS